MTSHGPAQVHPETEQPEKGSEWVPILLAGLGAFGFLVLALIIVFLTSDVRLH